MKKILLPLLCFLISYNSFCQSIYQDAYKEYMYGDLSKSIELFSKSIKNNEEVTKAYMYRGAANIFMDNFVDAKKDLDVSYKMDSLNCNIYFYYGKLYMFIREYVTALNYYNEAIKKNIKYDAAYNERSANKCMLGDYEGAIIDADFAININSSKEVYFTNRGYAKLKLNKYNEAIKDFDNSLKLQVNQKAYANRGLANSLLGFHLKAVDDYSKSLSINLNDKETYYLRGLSYEALNIKNKACEDYYKSYGLKYYLAEECLKRLNCY